MKFSLRIVDNLPSAAAINRDTGEILWNKQFDYLSDSVKQFIILHEIGHYVNQSDDEFEADLYAIKKILGTVKNSCKSILYALLDGLRFNKELDYNRFKQAFKECLKYEISLKNEEAANLLNNILLIEQKNMENSNSNWTIERQYIIEDVGTEAANMSYFSLGDIGLGFIDDAASYVKDTLAPATDLINKAIATAANTVGIPLTPEQIKNIADKVGSTFTGLTPAQQADVVKQQLAQAPASTQSGDWVYVNGSKTPVLRGSAEYNSQMAAAELASAKNAQAVLDANQRIADSFSAAFNVPAVIPPVTVTSAPSPVQTVQTVPTQETQETKTTPPPPSKTWIWVSLAVVGVLVISIVSYFIYKSKK